MSRKVKWGVLSTARIGLREVIPAMQRGNFTEITAIASRSVESARDAARQMNIPKFYGSYEKLLEDPEIEAVYIPLPNHMHIPWIRASVDAGKHVLCEKPLVLHAEEVEEVMELRDRSGLCIGEAVMILHHPRWIRMKQLIEEGAAGSLRSISGFFGYCNVDPQNIRNQVAAGGGALYDIGCYPITAARMLFGEEPVRGAAVIQKDPEFGVDRLSSVMLQFPRGHAVFTVATQVSPCQTVTVHGTKQWFDIPWPFNAPIDRPLEIRAHTGEILEPVRVYETFPPCDHYTFQGDAFSRSIREGVPFAGTLENARTTANILDALFCAAETGKWVEIS